MFAAIRRNSPLLIESWQEVKGENNEDDDEVLLPIIKR